MKLLVDVGNTRIKSATWDDGVLRPLPTLGHEGRVHSALVALMDGLAVGVDQVFVAAVAGHKVTESIREVLSADSQAEVLFAKTEREFQGLVNSYKDPARMGVDRWLAMIGALPQEECPLCVVDCGSAITIDVVSRDRTHKGGYIVPGLQMAERSLLHKTENIVVNENIPLDTLSWGASTEEAVQMGVITMALDFISGCVRRIETQEGVAPKLILTGGDAVLLSRHLELASSCSPLLVLEGLAIYSGLYLS